MRTTILLPLLLWCSFILALPALGQRPSRSGIGLKLGFQWASQRAASLDYQPVPGAVAGVYFPIWAGNRLEIQPELLGSMQGSILTSREGTTNKLSMYYVQLPVSIKFFLSNSINVLGGVQGGKLLMATNGSENVDDQYQPYDFGFNLGAGLGTLTGFDFAVRYYTGMTPVLANDNVLYPTNRTIQLTAGYRFIQFRHSLLRKRRG